MPKQKQILVITGSPRKGGNSEQLADAFIAGAKEAGHAVHKFEAAFKNVKGCRGCDGCWPDAQTPCVQKDDFYETVPLLEKCEVLVLATPVYFWNFPAQIKAVIDRLYPFCSSRAKTPLAVKESVLLLVQGDTDEATYRHTTGAYKDIAEYLGWKDKGIIAVKGVYGKSDIAGNAALKKAAEAGKNI